MNKTAKYVGMGLVLLLALIGLFSLILMTMNRSFWSGQSSFINSPQDSANTTDATQLAQKDKVISALEDNIYQLTKGSNDAYRNVSAITACKAGYLESIMSDTQKDVDMSLDTYYMKGNSEVNFLVINSSSYTEEECKYDIQPVLEKFATNTLKDITKIENCSVLYIGNMMKEDAALIFECGSNGVHVLNGSDLLEQKNVKTIVKPFNELGGSILWSTTTESGEYIYQMEHLPTNMCDTDAAKCTTLKKESLAFTKSGIEGYWIYSAATKTNRKLGAL